MRTHFQARLNTEENPETFRILQEWRSHVKPDGSRFSDREILDTALKALEGWSIDDFANVSMPGGAFKHMLYQAIARLGLPTVEDVEEVVSRAVEGLALSSGKRSRKSTEESISKELRDALKGNLKSAEEDW